MNCVIYFTSLAVACEYEPYRDVKTLVSNAWGTNVVSTFAYTYDPIGRRTQRIDDATTTNLFAYNPRSELTSAAMGTNSYAYAYDPIGNCLSSSENGTTTTYAANSLNQYTALNPASTNPTPFTYDPDGIGGLLQTCRGATNAFSFYDGNGNTTATADDAGIILGSYAYDSFGNEFGAQPITLGINPFHFSTKSQDGVIDMCYYGYRYGAAWLGRWLSRDFLEKTGVIMYICFHGTTLSITWICWVLSHVADVFQPRLVMVSGFFKVLVLGPNMRL